MRSTKCAKSRRLWFLRLAAILLGLLPFVAAEAALRLLDWPRRPPPVDPFVDLHNLRPLFEMNATTGRYEIGAQRLHLFRPASFEVPKASGTYRVFALGGSTTQGEPYSTETAFPEWLRLNLQAAAPQRQVEVINCGGLSYASYRVLAILREILAYEPDLVVIYTGQNEYLERRSYQGFHDPNFARHTVSRLNGLRLIQLARVWAGQAVSSTRPPLANRTELAEEVDALLDYQGGLDEYHRGAAWYAAVPAHFAWNLEQMIAACRSSAVPLVFVRPTANLLDCPPFKFESDPALADLARRDFERRWDAAKSTAATAPQSAMLELQQALEIDPQHAGARFLLGRLQFETGAYELARENLSSAKDNDVCPLRAPTAIQEAISRVAAQYHVPMLDADALYAARSPHGILGDNWLVDHIHPTLEGHQLLGEALAELTMAEKLFAKPAAGWEQRRKQLYEEHLSSLSEAYFHRGKQRLEGLLLWTQGRAKKIRPGD